MNQSDYLQLRELRDLQERMNRFFEDARGREAARDEEEWAQGVDWTPPVDIYEGDGQIILKMDLPEVEQKGIDIRVDGESPAVIALAVCRSSSTSRMRILVSLYPVVCQAAIIVAPGRA